MLHPLLDHLLCKGKLFGRILCDVKSISYSNYFGQIKILQTENTHEDLPQCPQVILLFSKIGKVLQSFYFFQIISDKLFFCNKKYTCPFTPKAMSNIVLDILNF
jgi:hypothetical protein